MDKDFIYKSQKLQHFLSQELTKRTYPKDKDSKKKVKMTLRRKQHTHKDQRPSRRKPKTQYFKGFNCHAHSLLKTLYSHTPKDLKPSTLGAGRRRARGQGGGEWASRRASTKPWPPAKPAVSSPKSLNSAQHRGANCLNPFTATEVTTPLSLISRGAGRGEVSELGE